MTFIIGVSIFKSFTVSCACLYKIVSLFYGPVMIVRGGLRSALDCPSICLSVCSSHLQYRVCVMSSFHSFQLSFFKLCILIVVIIKMYIWRFNGDKINFDRITTFFFYTIGYGVCVINSFYSFQWVFFKLCVLVVVMIKMYMWSFNGDKINFDRIMFFF